MHRRSLPALDPFARLIEGEGGDGGGTGTDTTGNGGDGASGGGEGKADDTGGSGDGGSGDDDDTGGSGTDDAADKGADKGADGKTGKTYDEKYVASLRDENAKARRKADEREAALVKGLRKLLGEDADQEETDPAKLAGAAVKERDDYRDRLSAKERELAVVYAAGDLGVDAKRVNDSKAFERALAELDPAADKFADQVKALIRKAAEKDPALRVKPAPGKPSNGERMGGEAGLDGQLTRSQLKTMTPKQIEEARAAGKLQNLLGG